MKRVRADAEASAKRHGYAEDTEYWAGYCHGYENGHKRGTTHGRDLERRRARKAKP